MCAILGSYLVFFKLSGRDRVSGRSGPEKWILGEILLLFAPGHSPKLILTASGGPLEVGVAFSTAQSAEVWVAYQGHSRIISVDNGFSALDSFRMLPRLLEDLLKPSG